MKANLSLISFRICLEMVCSFLDRLKPSKDFLAAPAESRVIWLMFWPPTLTARLSFLNLAPLHLGQGRMVIYCSIHSRTPLDSVCRNLRSRLGITPSKVSMYSPKSRPVVVWYLNLNSESVPYSIISLA